MLKQQQILILNQAFLKLLPADNISKFTVRYFLCVCFKPKTSLVSLVLEEYASLCVLLSARHHAINTRCPIWDQALKQNLSKYLIGEGERKKGGKSRINESGIS